MGLETIDPIVRKSTPRFTKSPSLVLIRLVLTEIQAFKNVKKLQTNACMEKIGNADKSGISIHFFVNFFRFQMPVSQSKLA